MRRQTANAPLLLIRSTPEAATRPPHPLVREAELRGLRQPINAWRDALEGAPPRTIVFVSTRRTAHGGIGQKCSLRCGMLRVTARSEFAQQ